jgi:hypothetical protein
MRAKTLARLLIQQTPLILSSQDLSLRQKVCLGSLEAFGLLPV